MLTETLPPIVSEGGVAGVVQLFSNPSSGRYSTRRIGALIEAFERRGARVLHCETGAGRPVIAPEAVHVCVAGGDGTVRHVAAAVIGTGRTVAMSIYPMGTVNLLAKELGYPRDPVAFAALVLGRERQRPHYPVAIGDDYFFACAAVGPDSFTVAGVSLRLKRRIGRLAYVVSFMRLLRRWPRHRITLLIDAREIRCEAFYLAKGRYYAGRWSIASAARCHDPVLHVVALKRASRRDYARFVLGLVLGRPTESQQGVEVLACRTLTVTSERPLPIQADGDIVGEVPAAIEVCDRPLTFC